MHIESEFDEHFYIPGYLNFNLTITGSKRNLALALEDLAFVLYPTTHVLPSSHHCLLQVLVVLVIATC